MRESDQAKMSASRSDRGSAYHHHSDSWNESWAHAVPSIRGLDYVKEMPYARRSPVSRRDGSRKGWSNVFNVCLVHANAGRKTAQAIAAISLDRMLTILRSDIEKSRTEGHKRHYSLEHGMDKTAAMKTKGCPDGARFRVQCPCIPSAAMFHWPTSSHATLVLVPPSLIPGWPQEFKKFLDLGHNEFKWKVRYAHDSVVSSPGPRIIPLHRDDQSWLISKVASEVHGQGYRADCRDRYIVVTSWQSYTTQVEDRFRTVVKVGRYTQHRHLDL